jgi:Flavodoxin domain
MKALVVYESMYGNTRHVAEAIAEGLRTSIRTDVVLARDSIVADLDGAELIVAGGPTHAWGMSSRRTRDAATLDAVKHPDHLLENASVATGVREWLRRMKGRGACQAVAFDTRVDKSKLLTGSAARVIQRGLRTAGFSVFDHSKSFRVTASAGPLVSGEIDRARQWGEAMGRRVLYLAPASTLADFSHE